MAFRINFFNSRKHWCTVLAALFILVTAIMGNEVKANDEVDYSIGCNFIGVPQITVECIVNAGLTEVNAFMGEVESSAFDGSIADCKTIYQKQNTVYYSGNTENQIDSISSNATTFWSSEPDALACAMMLCGTKSLRDGTNTKLDNSCAWFDVIALTDRDRSDFRAALQDLKNYLALIDTENNFRGEYIKELNHKAERAIAHAQGKAKHSSVKEAARASEEADKAMKTALSTTVAKAEATDVAIRQFLTKICFSTAITGKLDSSSLVEMLALMDNYDKSGELSAKLLASTLRSGDFIYRLDTTTADLVMHTINRPDIKSIMSRDYCEFDKIFENYAKHKDVEKLEGHLNDENRRIDAECLLKMSRKQNLKSLSGIYAIPNCIAEFSSTRSMRR